jgi:hypothetical protein
VAAPGVDHRDRGPDELAGATSFLDPVSQRKRPTVIGEIVPNEQEPIIKQNRRKRGSAEYH